MRVRGMAIPGVILAVVKVVCDRNLLSTDILNLHAANCYPRNRSADRITPIQFVISCLFSGKPSNISSGGVQGSSCLLNLLTSNV